MLRASPRCRPCLQPASDRAAPLRQDGCGHGPVPDNCDSVCSPVWSSFFSRCKDDIDASDDAEAMHQFTDLCRASAPGSCGGEGLIFEAYEPGDSFDWESLAGLADTVARVEECSWDRSAVPP